MIIETYHKKENEPFQYPDLCIAAAIKLVSSRPEMEEDGFINGVHRISSHCLSFERDEVYAFSSPDKIPLFLAQYGIAQEPHYGEVYTQLACITLTDHSKYPNLMLNIHRLFLKLGKESGAKHWLRGKRISDNKYLNIINKLH